MKLFLDDIRDPINCTTYMYGRIGKDNIIYLDKHWSIVRNYEEFVKYLEKSHILMTFPELISFDHDLHEEHYLYDEMDAPNEKYEEKTGYDCLKFLIDMCLSVKRPIPKCIFHTMNPVGRERMQEYYNKFIKKEVE